MMKMKPLFLLPGAIALMLAAAPVIPSLTNAAIAAPGQAGGQRGGAFKQLNLTDAQKAQMKQIRQSTRQQMDAILTSEQKEQLRPAKEQRQRPNLNLTDDQKARMKEIRQSSKSQMDAILTAEQKQQLQQLRQQRGQRRQQQPQ